MGLSWVICTFLFACSHWGPVQAAAPDIEVIHCHTVYSAGPHWDTDTKMLYFVDALGKSVNRFDPNSTTTTSINLGDTVSIIIPIQGESDKFLITLGDKIAVLCWDGVSSKPCFVKILGVVGRPFDGTHGNDGKADANGLLWAGTFVLRRGSLEFVPDAGVLFSLSKWRVPQIHAKGLTLSNGIAWNIDNTQLYFVDSAARVIYAFDFDLHRSLITNPRVIFDFKSKGVEGLPGGITIDSDDRLWIACFSAGQIIQIDPATGDLLRTVSIPSIQVTSVAFGGTNLDELFVTSGNININPEVLYKYQAPGCVFRVTGLGVQGLPANRVIL